MIDPFTALAIAQSAVTGIKKAVALGKDVKSLINEFSSFYENADHVHVASTKLKIASINKSDAQISSDALKIAMASKALRDHERELKDMLFWSGNAQVWEEMMAERTRMAKERTRLELEANEKRQKDKAAMYNTFWNVLLFVAIVALVIPVIGLTLAFSSKG
jgi:ABC-type sugar transport system permease subunit